MPRNSAPTAPSQKAWTISGTSGISRSTISAPAITPRMAMNWLISPARRARSGIITNRNAVATEPARLSPTSIGLTSFDSRSWAHSSPRSPKIAGQNLPASDDRAAN
jgi:hypothetical protein